MFEGQSNPLQSWNVMVVLYPGCKSSLSIAFPASTRASTSPGGNGTGRWNSYGKSPPVSFSCSSSSSLLLPPIGEPFFIPLMLLKGSTRMEGNFSWIALRVVRIGRGVVNINGLIFRLGSSLGSLGLKNLLGERLGKNMSVRVCPIPFALDG